MCDWTEYSPVSVYLSLIVKYSLMCECSAQLILISINFPVFSYLEIRISL